MGCGKSSVGRKLSELLCCPFMDLDAEIEARCGCTVAEIFAERGEAEFRRLEKETLKDILETSEIRQCAPLAPSQLSLGPSPYPGVGKCQLRTTALSPRHNQVHHSKANPKMVVALGGGAVMTKECEDMVHRQTVCVYLKASVDELVSRLSEESAGRPLLNTTDLRTRILDLMSKRASTYERVAHLVIDTDDKTIDQVASEITTLLPSKR